MTNRAAHRVNRLEPTLHQNQFPSLEGVLTADLAQTQLKHHTFARVANDDDHNLELGKHHKSQNVGLQNRLSGHKTP